MKVQLSYPKFFIILLLACFSLQCAPRLFVSYSGDAKFRKIIAESGFLEDQFSGMMLYDPTSNKSIFELRSNRYFTPASNTKILTLYAALSYLGDSLPALAYAEDEDYIYVKGMADPTLLHPDFEQYQKHFSFLSDTSKSIRYIDPDFKDVRFGAGWSWDDYADGYQVEKTPMPLYGNRVSVTMVNGQLITQPSYYRQFFEANTSLPRTVFRDECSNAFSYNPTKLEERENSIPYIYSNFEHSKLLSDAWDRDVKPYYSQVPDNLVFSIVYQTPIDTALRKMMHPSDNFMAEQLLLSASQVKLGYMNTDSIIAFAQKDILKDTPDRLQWYDGSGLSRYNMFSPGSVVYVLNDIMAKVGTMGVQDIFAKGGVSGTIQNWYKGETEPYVFAKTGTLKNLHCLSGFVKTKSGKMLIFSMLNGNYVGSSSNSKKKMQTILEYIQDHY